MRISYEHLKKELKRVLLELSFKEEKAELCASIFADNSRDGVYSHGINRFSVFVNYVKEGFVQIDSEPQVVERNGLIEKWDGQLGPGMYNATKAMNRAISIAKTNGIGCVVLKNTNHWMRGGSYGWQAADAGCIGICFSNTIANMPPWGGREPTLGNNPLVIAVPRTEGHLVLDMAISQFSYGKLQEHDLKNKKLPSPGGYDEDGNLSTDASAIIKSERMLPIGLWKGSGLSFMLDVVLTMMTNGKSTSEITKSKREAGLSQFFLCFNQNNYNKTLIEEIIQYTKSSALINKNDPILYPGENTFLTRQYNEKHGIPVDINIWNNLLEL